MKGHDSNHVEILEKAIKAKDPLQVLRIAGLENCETCREAAMVALALQQSGIEQREDLVRSREADHPALESRLEAFLLNEVARPEVSENKRKPLSILRLSLLAAVVLVGVFLWLRKDSQVVRDDELRMESFLTHGSMNPQGEVDAWTTFSWVIPSDAPIELSVFEEVDGTLLPLNTPRQLPANAMSWQPNDTSHWPKEIVWILSVTSDSGEKLSYRARASRR